MTPEADRFEATPLVAAASLLDAPAVVGAGVVWTWRQVHEAAIAFAARLEGASAVCNLCSSRIGFLVAWLAALRSRTLIVLPPSGGTADLATILAAHERPVVAGDVDLCAGAWTAGGTPLACRPDWRPAMASAAELEWTPAWDETAVLLYTSGSTGTPEPQPKTLRHLAAGARVLARRLEEDVAGGVAAIERIVCSVPPQHMFGLECSVMLPLVEAIPVLDRRPLLPADVGDAFDAAPPGAWVTTPLHLRSLVHSDATLAGCRVVIASTMPLSQTLARAGETATDAPVLEIYGSTETGALAMRRTARDARWTALDGVRLRADDDATVAHGTHFASPATLLDTLAIAADGTFELLGRQTDVVKIAGRRASLARLNLLLQDLPGLDDGVFYLPPNGSETERLCLIHAGPPLDRRAAERWLRERLDPVFLPRTWIHLDRLPRSDTGKLRLQALDRAYEAWLAGSASSEPPAARDAPGERAARIPRPGTR